MVNENSLRPCEKNKMVRKFAIMKGDNRGQGRYQDGQVCEGILFKWRKSFELKLQKSVKICRFGSVPI